MTARRTTAALLLTTVLLPAAATAQQRRQPSLLGSLREAADRVDLSAEQKAKVDDILKAGQAELKTAMADAQGAPGDEQAARMADVQQKFDDVVNKVEAEMTAEQRPKFESARATAAVDSAKTQVEAIKTATAAADLTDDQRTAAKAAFAEADKVIDGSTVDAAQAKHPQDAADVQIYVAQSTSGMQRDLIQAVGRDKAVAIYKAAGKAAGK